MTLRERFDKLEPRERRLLGILGALFAVRIRFGQSSSSTSASTVGRIRSTARRVAQLKSSGA